MMIAKGSNGLKNNLYRVYLSLREEGQGREKEKEETAPEK